MIKKMVIAGVACLALGVLLEGLAIKNHFEIINYVEFPPGCAGCLPPSSFPVPLIVIGAILLVSGASMLFRGYRKKPVEIDNPK